VPHIITDPASRMNSFKKRALEFAVYAFIAAALDAV